MRTTLFSQVYRKKEGEGCEVFRSSVEISRKPIRAQLALHEKCLSKLVIENSL